MTISTQAWERYIDALRKVNDAAYEAMRKYIARFGMPTEQWQVNAMIEAAASFATNYGEASAALAAEFYDLMAELSGVVLPPALPADPATIDEVAKAVVGTLKTGNEEIVSAAVARLVKMAGVDTTMQNALRDGAEWAWIPHGDTCAFCITLASNDWQRASEKAIKNGHAEHIHANCDCTYAVRFDGQSNVEGYDPEKYKDMYDFTTVKVWDPDDEEYTYQMRYGTPKDKINGLRREFYAQNREKILEQKRDAYARRKALNSSKAEEINVD